MKYKFSFELLEEDIEGQLFSYETNQEPFRLGELINISELVKDRRFDDYFIVKQVWRMPISLETEEVLFSLKRYFP